MKIYGKVIGLRVAKGGERHITIKTEENPFFDLDFKTDQFDLGNEVEIEISRSYETRPEITN